MNTRRSQSVKLISSQSKIIEVEIEGTSQMNTVYCCIANGHQILYVYNSNLNQIPNPNSNSNSNSLDSLALLCLENVPAHHKYHFHTVGTRTFGLLISEGLTYFAIVDPSVGNLGILHFLENIRDGHKNSVRNGHNDSLVPIIKKLIASLEHMPKSTYYYRENGESGPNGDCNPLLGINGSRKKMKERERENEENNIQIRGLEEGGSSTGLSVERNPSSGRTRRQGHALWRRHVKIVILIDVALCVVLFIVWLVVCKGFQCVK